MLIRSPASSANLGPGFDCFGIAWQLYNEIEFIPEEDIVITGCDEKFRNTENLACKAYTLTLEKSGVKEKGVHIRFVQTDIPVSRGLGSSSALIVAGVTAADRLFKLGLSDTEKLTICTELEGHPDNAAPALLGGLTASAMLGAEPVTVRYPLSDRLHFAALVPPFELSTALSRSVLPEKVARGDAVFNISRSALVLHALGSGDAELLGRTMEDRLHQPYRLPLIAGYDTAREIARACGAEAMCISGAGSTLLAVSDSDDLARKLSAAVTALPGWRVLELLPENAGCPG